MSTIVKPVDLKKDFTGLPVDVGSEMAREACRAVHAKMGTEGAVELACGLIAGAVGVLAGMSSQEHAAGVLEAAARALRELGDTTPDARH